MTARGNAGGKMGEWLETNRSRQGRQERQGLGAVEPQPTFVEPPQSGVLDRLGEGRADGSSGIADCGRALVCSRREASRSRVAVAGLARFLAVEFGVSLLPGVLWFHKTGPCRQKRGCRGKTVEKKRTASRHYFGPRGTSVRIQPFSVVCGVSRWNCDTVSIRLAPT
jgi:hypothetical protein